MNLFAKFGLLLLVAGILAAPGTTRAEEPLQQRVATETDPKADPRDDCKIISARFSAHPKKGEEADLTVTVKNTGSTVWVWRDPYHHYSLGLGPATNYKGKPSSIRVIHPGGAMPGGFEGNRITLTEKEQIKPGQTKAFGCRVRYETAGKGVTVLRMVRENEKAVGQKKARPDGWFGERLDVIVTVTD